MKKNSTTFLSQLWINNQNKLWPYLFILLSISSFFSLLNFKSLNLNVGLPATMFFIDYEDRTRTTSWLEIAKEESDPFITQIAKDQKTYRISWGLYSFAHLPAHFFFKVFKLRGENLWFAIKILHVFMGLSITVLEAIPEQYCVSGGGWW